MCINNQKMDIDGLSELIYQKDWLLGLLKCKPDDLYHRMYDIERDLYEVLQDIHQYEEEHGMFCPLLSILIDQIKTDPMIKEILDYYGKPEAGEEVKRRQNLVEDQRIDMKYLGNISNEN